ncbi:twin-arginine translocase TatA/TatE family subunit [bacterium]|nr:twin-arginine translocase TatA/TatE family subunit [bacterium]
MRAGFWEILLIVVLVLILFGHGKIPDLMKNLAGGINAFKKELKDDGKASKKDAAAKQAATKKAATKKVAPKKAVKKSAPKKK